MPEITLIDETQLPLPVTIIEHKPQAFGWTPYLKDGLTTVVQTVKSLPGTLGGWYIYNPNAAVTYVQIFDISGTVTLGTSVPKLSIGVPPGSAANVEISEGVAFFTAIKIAATTTAKGNSAPVSGVDVNLFFR